jgi:hypothetical protein
MTAGHSPHGRHDPVPPDPVELERRAWRCLTDAGRPLTAPALADLAGLTRGGALRFLTGWVAAGRANRTAPAGGRYSPYAAVFTATPVTSTTATQLRPARRPTAAGRRRAGARAAGPHLIPEPANV